MATKVKRFKSNLKLTPVRAIRAKCLECSETTVEVRLCPVADCPLWPFRMGERPTTTMDERPELLDPLKVIQAGFERAAQECSGDAGDWFKETPFWREVQSRAAQMSSGTDRPGKSAPASQFGG